MRHFTRSQALVSLLALVASAQNIECPTGNGVGIIVARASTERPGTGIIGAVADDVASQIPGSTITAVDYPATLQNYQASEAEGVAEMTRLIQEFNANCAGSQMVLMGYSQVIYIHIYFPSPFATPNESSRVPHLNESVLYH
jgi:acetylxylan esterase